MCIVEPLNLRLPSLTSSQGGGGRQECGRDLVIANQWGSSYI